MARRSLKALATLTLGLAVSSLAMPAYAGKKEKADAEKLIAQAMDEDYLNLELDKAETKLKDALKKCGDSACGAQVLGRVHVALATVHGVGQNKLDLAKADLVRALQADPGAKLIDGLSNPEFEKLFKAAQAEAAGGGAAEAPPAPPASGGGSGASAPPAASGGAEGDFQHSPFAEQAVNVPLPVYAEIPEDLGATKVIVRYKPYGGGKWESLALKKLPEGWGGEIPCEATSVTGDLKYYIIGSDETGTPVATAGSTKQPFKVAIKNKIKGEKPALPGSEPPSKCAAKEDCPPGLPGCGANGAGSSRGGKVEGSICEKTQECGENLVCDSMSGTCIPGQEPKSSTSASGKRHNVTLGLQLDLALLGTGESVCSSSNSGTYVCTEESGEQFFGTPSDRQNTNGVSGGFGLGGARILAGYDYVFPFGLGLGGRVGYAFGGPQLGDEQPPDNLVNADGEGVNYPKGNSFLPFHVEGRVSWRFLRPSPGKGEWAPHAFIGTGLGQVNASVPVRVCDTSRAEPGDDSDCPGETTVDAYQLTGLNFVSFGGGATYMFHENFGIVADLKAMVMFTSLGFVFAPTVSPVFAF